MKLIAFLIISCLAFHTGKGAPRRAVYKFVKCNPEGNQANCITHKSAKMAWSPELPTKLPAADALYLKAKPVEEEHPLREEKEKKEEEAGVKKDKKETLKIEDLESHTSAYYEGSGLGDLSEDRPIVNAESETGSGGLWEKEDVVQNKALDVIIRNWMYRKAKPEEWEMREEQFLKL
ncbi:serglycin [Antennarius striatus]|uniref:serglycin n=1 Tax=Antennarius striatus TaxID=241820 RepID=UPI0035ADC951